MSGFHDIYVAPAAPALVPIITPIISSVAALAVAGGAAYAAYLAIQKLKTDYRDSLDELQKRTRDAQQEREADAEAQRTSDQAARALAKHTLAHPDTDATVQFLLARVGKLSERLNALPSPDPSLPAQCVALRQALADASGDLGIYIEQYSHLVDAVAEASAAYIPVTKSAMAAEVTALRDDLLSPIFATTEVSTARIQLMGQLDALESMLQRNPDVAAQGLSLLRERIRREMQLQVEHRLQRDMDAEELRALVNDTLAKLQALTMQTTLPELRAQAEAMLANLAATLASVDNELARVRELAEDAATLYATCQHLLEEQAVSAYISEQIRDVLLSLGYQVSMVPAEGNAATPALVAAVGQGVGVQFQTDGTGHLKTGVVAFDAQHAVADAGTKPKVCALVDAVLVTLQERDWHVREKFRITVKEGEQLQVVSLPRQEAPTTTSAATAQYMKVDDA